MAKILVADDEAKIRNVIREYAVFDGHEVYEADNGEEAVRICEVTEIDIIVMDVMMPKLNGFEAYEKIKKLKDIPVLILSARGEEYDKLHGFSLGIEDYVVKPFSPKELMARLGVIDSRHRAIENMYQKHDVFQFEGLIINMGGRIVTVDDQKVVMTPREYDLLFFLIKNKGVVFSRDSLLSKVWGYDYEGDSRTVDTHIKLLRKSLGRYRQFIVTYRGAGYKFEAD